MARRRLRKLFLLGGVAAALAWWRERKLAENERRFGSPSH
jgi:hypothetical protein